MGVIGVWGEERKLFRLDKRITASFSYCVMLSVAYFTALQAHNALVLNKHGPLLLVIKINECVADM